MNPVTAPHSMQLASKNIDKRIKTRRNPNLPLELIFRILGEAGRPLELLFKDSKVGELKEIHSKAYWVEIAKSTAIPISQKTAFSGHEAVKQEIVSYCKTLTNNPSINLPKEIYQILEKGALTTIDLRRLADWKEARDNVVILRVLRKEEKMHAEDLDYKSTLSKGRGKAFDDAFADWKKKIPTHLARCFPFSALTHFLNSLLII